MTRRPLGRGLDALIDSGRTEPAADKTHENGDNGRGGVMMVMPDRILASPFQPRRHFDQERLQELANAIKSQGIIEPLIVRRANANGDGPRYELVAGERRLRASIQAGLTEVPVIVREIDDRTALEMSLVENLLREDLNPIEEGRAFVRLNREFSQSHEQIAAQIGKSRPYVSNAIRLLELPIPVVEMIARGEITAGQARPLLGLQSPEEQIAAARRISEGKISARGAEAIASQNRAVRSGSSPRSNSGDPNVNALAESIQRALKRRVRIVRNRAKGPGRLEIEFYNEDDLTTLGRLLIAAGRAATTIPKPAA